MYSLSYAISLDNFPSLQQAFTVFSSERTPQIKGSNVTNFKKCKLSPYFFDGGNILRNFQLLCLLSSGIFKTKNANGRHAFSMILGEMVNLQKVNSLKTPNIAFWLFYAQVDHFS
jgi:hypothetical protein